MALELRIEGPGLDVVRRLEPGQPELVLGRGSECEVCLPDPLRRVSRRHLSVWLETGQMHFRVLSVNGVRTPVGEVPPGARGVLPAGQTLRLAEYNLTVRALREAARASDPAALFDREHSGFAPFDAAQPEPPALGHPPGPPVRAPSEEDPFGEWEFEAAFRPGGGREGGQSAGTGGATDMAAFFQGLGLDPATLGPLSLGELETIGKLVRTLALGLLQLHATAAGVKGQLRAEDRTLVGTTERNPLRADWPEETRLRYLFGGRAAAVGLIGPEPALQELIEELVAHELAAGKAARAVVKSTLAEFEPVALRARLLGDGLRLFANQRAWNAYERFYREQALDLPRWTQRLLDRYFAEPYLRESLRIRRETSQRQR